MTTKEALEAIENIPLGATIQLIKTNGDIIEVRLASREVEGIAEKNYGDMVVPELPPALVVQGGTRFGNFRIDTNDIVKIARIA